MIIGIDLGGTKIAGADDKGNPSHKVVTLLEGKGGKQVGAAIGEVIQGLLEKAPGPVSSVGIAIPGIYRPETGTVWAPNISQWEDYPLRNEINSLVGSQGIEVHIDSDRSCYILGEIWKGAAGGLGMPYF